MAGIILLADFFQEQKNWLKQCLIIGFVFRSKTLLKKFPTVSCPPYSNGIRKQYNLFTIWSSRKKGDSDVKVISVSFDVSLNFFLL